MADRKELLKEAAEFVRIIEPDDLTYALRQIGSKPISGKEALVLLQRASLPKIETFVRALRPFVPLSPATQPWGWVGWVRNGKGLEPEIRSVGTFATFMEDTAKVKLGYCRRGLIFGRKRLSCSLT